MSVFSKEALAGKKTIITGGNRGIGLALVAEFVKAGADVLFIARDAAKNDETVASLAKQGLQVRAVSGDLVTEAGAKKAIGDAAKLLGGVDILVNNAGTCYHTESVNISDSEWDSVFDLNVKALFHCSVAAAEHMKNGGSIVNIGSISALIVNRPQWQAHYNASKAAVHQLTKSLAAEWAPRRIRLNAVAPGYVKTEMAPVDRPEFKRYWIDDAPQQRYALPEEIAPLVVFLASDAASFMTGSVVVIDGGYTLW